MKMTDVPKKTKDEKFTLRLDKDLKKILDRIAELEKSMNKSQIIREGLQLWINLRINAIINPGSDLCMFSMNMLKKALDSMNEKELHQLSLLAFENAKKSADGVKEIFGSIDGYVNSNGFMEDIEKRISGLIKAVYGPTGYRWFDSIVYEKKNGKLIIQGNHRLGSNFSKFFRFHISNHMKHFDYELETISVNYEIKNSSSQIDQIRLVFIKKGIEK
jgi:hypothetical protein